MKTLIVYATKYGATKRIGEIIAERLGGATLQDVRSDRPFSLANYDCVVLGSPLTAGMIRREIKDFAAKHADELKTKRLGLFVSGLQEEGESEYLKKNFPPELLDAAKAKAFLGGVFDPKKCGFLDRTMIRIVAKLNSYTSTIDDDKIRLFAQELAV